MTETHITEAMGLLGSSVAGPLRKLFYQRNGLPKQGLLTNEAIFKKLGVDEYNPNTLEKRGLSHKLGETLARLRKQAKDAGLAWIDFESSTTGQKVSRHGFLDDIEKIIDNAMKFEEIAHARMDIALVTKAIADKKLIELKA